MTYSNIGKKRRLDRLFTEGKTLVVPVDDSLIFGPKQGLLDLEDTIRQIVSSSPNALLGFKKDLEIITEMAIQTPFIYNVTASTVLKCSYEKK